jgi:two-component system sensor histidine kinase BaeS
MMKVKLSYKIFVAFTLTLFIIVTLMVGLIKFYVARNFADYANKSLLERHRVVAAALAIEFETHKSWLPLRDNARRWKEILRSSLPPRWPPKRIQRLSRRLALFDADKQHIAGGRARVSYDRYTLQEITVAGKTAGWLGLHKKEQLKDPLVVRFLKQQSQVLYLIGGAILVLAAIVAFLLSKQLLAPIRKLTTGTQTLASRKFDTRIEVESNDELGQLSADFNTMAQTLEEYERMQRQWISDIAHELRTPLSILRGEIEALKDGVREVNHDTLHSLYSEIIHLSKIVNDLHELSLAESGALSFRKLPVDPVAVLKETIGHFKQSFVENQIAIEKHLENQTPITIIGDADRLRQLFTNLLENTLRYADAPGILRIGQEYIGNRLIMFFEDSGPGVPEEALDHLFDRLYRVDRSRSRTQGGSGLGLSICKSIVTAHGGEIRVANGNSGGLRIEVGFTLNG